MRPNTIIASALRLATVTYASSAPVYTSPNPTTHINYTVVPGIFQQDDAATNASTFNFTASNFGLIDRSYPSDSACAGSRGSKNATQWQKITHYITTLNNDYDAKRNGERYALLFLGRHGEGYHNVAESYYGTPAWNCYWSELDGNGTAVWTDAHLTPTGQEQALSVNRFWNSLITKEKTTPPESYYTSPMYRCLETSNLTFSGLPLPKKTPFLPTIKELFREGISAHTCDRRSNKTYLAENFPKYKFEEGFVEFDPFWQEMHSEPSVDQDIRSKIVLDDVFTNDKSTYISVTAHSGEIGSLLRVLGHRAFGLSTGAAIPVLVKATTVRGESPVTTTIPYPAQKTCALPPTIRDPSCNDCSCCS
ncbi:phosphoglycerate mutase family protein [Massarina eburnea CBS 473.64]|uniref:Phosphoglycerate mutase family protein n=1 Tax=Massarina eburnea CBS 473.64 TaxID=1395130 RepID=A0A6A6S791_9PLEO|nr:phosphoglycerate mutase family protein [Massarina eburnea CBS 473.64]